MGKRLTETEKWNDKWFRSLKPHEKLLWLYFCDMCNLAGFIEMDEEKISFDTKLTEEEVKEAYQGLQRGLIASVESNWIFLKNFLRHQKNLPLNPDNNAHKHIISKINEQAGRFELNIISEILGANMGLNSPIGKGIGKGKGKEGGMGETNGAFREPEKFDPKIPDDVAEAFSDVAWQEHVGVVTYIKGGVAEVDRLAKLFLREQLGVDGLKRPLFEIKQHFQNWAKKKAREPKQGSVIRTQAQINE